MKLKLILAFALAFLSQGLVQCEWECCPEDVESSSDNNTQIPRVPQPPPAPNDDCDEWNASDECYDENHSITNDCRSPECFLLNIHLHYMLSEDLGRENQVVVEAFDNYLFQGQPVSSTRITGYDASFVGANRLVQLGVAPGEYYIRAYIDTDAAPALPYQYGDLEVVSDAPFGVYGALSAVSKIDVPQADPKEGYHIYLNKLFELPQDAVPTNAFLRLIIDGSLIVDVPDGQKIYLELHEFEDFAYHPVYRFHLPSESLMITGQEGYAEFVSDELDTGEYFVFAYLDTNGNGYFDTGEPQKAFTRYGQVARLAIIADRTETVTLTLDYID